MMLRLSEGYSLKATSLSSRTWEGSGQFLKRITPPNPDGVFTGVSPLSHPKKLEARKPATHARRTSGGVEKERVILGLIRNDLLKCKFRMAFPVGSSGRFAIVLINTYIGQVDVAFPTLQHYTQEAVCEEFCQ